MNFILFFIDFYYIFMETFLEFVAFFNKQSKKQSKIETNTPSKISIFHGKNAKKRFSCPVENIIFMH